MPNTETKKTTTHSRHTATNARALGRFFYRSTAPDVKAQKSSHGRTHVRLHPILKGMGRESAGHSAMSEVRTMLIDYWMGHANGEMAGRYGKQLLDNVRWRQEC